MKLKLLARILLCLGALTPFSVFLYIEGKDIVPENISLILFGICFCAPLILLAYIFGCFDWIINIFSKSYKEIYFRKDVIIIEEEKKGLFSSNKVKKEILIDDIIQISREEYQGNLNSITILLKDNKEEFLIAQECFDLEGLYKFVIKQRDLGKRIKIIKIDIETTKKTEV